MKSLITTAASLSIQPGNSSNRWMRVSVPATAGARPGGATLLFSGPYLNVLDRSHDVAPNGRHLLVAGPEQTTTNQLVW